MWLAQWKPSLLSCWCPVAEVVIRYTFNASIDNTRKDAFRNAVTMWRAAQRQRGCTTHPNASGLCHLILPDSSFSPTEVPPARHVDANIFDLSHLRKQRV